MKLDLLSLVSHELRTPLSSVLNAVRILKEDGGLDAESRARFLDMAYRNAERLNSTLNQLLDLSKLVSGRLVCRFHEVSLKQLMHAQLEQTRRDYNDRKLTVTGSLDSLPVILGDAPRLGQVIRSLIENAMRFSPPGSRIKLKVANGVKASELPKGVRRSRGRQPREFVLFELSNPVDERSEAKTEAAEVFKIFGQQEAVLNRAHEGVGGSLAIAAEVIRQHEGGLTATVADGIFTVWLALPALESQAALMKVLESRIFALRTEVGALSLVILSVNKGAVKAVHEALKSALFRATDTAYSLPDTNEVAVLMDDCKKADAPKLVKRLLDSLGRDAAGGLSTALVGVVSCPEDGTDPDGLIEQARAGRRPLSELTS